jgi:hypothetical protein
LPVPSFLQERDPSLFGLYNKIRCDDSIRGRTAFVCSVEAQLLVFPDRGPLKALIKGCQSLSRVEGFDPIKSRRLLESVATALKADDFWIPQGAASLDGFLKSMLGGGAGSAGTVADADEETVRECLRAHDWAWERLRDDLKETNPDLLRRIIGFRRGITASLMNRARERSAETAIARYGDRFRWVVYAAPGSDRLTSDYDVSTRGTATENVVKTFNALFRQWTLGLVDANGATRTGYAGPAAPGELESAYVFDVNVYSSDYNRDMGQRFLVEDAPDPDIWPAGAEDRKRAEHFQDAYALLKIRRYVADDVWDVFCKALRAALPGDAKTAAAAVVGYVNSLWVDLRSEVDTHAAGNAKMRAENTLYERQLDIVEAIRWNGGHPLDDAARVRLAEALGRAGFYAQEAYHTSGAMRDVVSNAQQRKGLRLSDMELLCSLNEQAGDIFKEIGHLAGGADPSADLAFAVKTSKYMVRLGNAALGLNYRVVNELLDSQFQSARNARRMFEKTEMPLEEVERILSGLSQPVAELVDNLLDLQTLCQAWRASTEKLLEIKDAPDDFPGSEGEAEKRRRIDATPWRQGRVDLRSFLIELVVSLNAQYRRGTRAEALSRFLRDILTSAMQAANMAKAETLA